MNGKFFNSLLLVYSECHLLGTKFDIFAYIRTIPTENAESTGDVCPTEMSEYTEVIGVGLEEEERI
jgi:hypothetical protein